MQTENSYPARTHYTAAKARGYQHQNPGKHRAEMRLVSRALDLIPTGRVLDLPCGGGRVSAMLAQKGYSVTAADLSDGMLDIARENLLGAGLTVPVEQQDAERLMYADGSFDAVVCFRLFHHFPDAEIRQRVVRELCRVARQRVAISYFSPWSPTALKRRWRQAMGGRKSHKYGTSLKEVRGYFEDAGFRLVRDFARLPFIHTLHLAVFELDERAGRIRKSRALAAGAQRASVSTRGNIQ